MDKHTAELIAAGEVVERPSSVVKELVENSIDAGATAVTVEIKNGGVKYIRITDNGCGIYSDDVRTAFLRHATSKISAGEDLDAISTLGFRGEALASVAAVSRVEMITHCAGEDSGVRYLIEGGEEVSFEEYGCADGTTIIIRDIFYNTPARMKFLKKDVSEGNAVAAIVDRISLSHPEISIKLIRDGKQTLSTPGDGKLRSAIFSVYGREFTEGLIPVDYSYNGVRVSGYVSKPTCARPNRSMQTFFINGRYCRSITMQTALENACKGSVMVGKHPACVLGIELACSVVDVNVHPAKLEVRFTNERPVYESVYYAVKSAIETGDSRREIKIPAQNSAQSLPIPEQVPLKPAQIQKNPEPPVQQRTALPEISPAVIIPDVKPAALPYYEERVLCQPVSPKPSFGVSDSGRRVDIDIEYTVKPSQAKQEEPAPKPRVIAEQPALEDLSGQPEVPAKDAFVLEDYKIIGEAFGTYIIIECGDKLVLIDKHAAHERLIYEKLISSEGGRSPQMLLESIPVTLEKQQYDSVMENLDVFAEAGFEIEDFGSGTVIVRAVPSVLSGGDIAGAVMEIAGKLDYRIGGVSTQRLENIFHTIACRSAIKAHDHSDAHELAALALELNRRSELRYCPHGRPISISLTKREIEKNFGRV